jgi:hypothetical protein
MPYTSADYLDDPQFQHRDFIDSAVAEEGLVAILGVPMRLGSRVIGVLFAANRSERPFDQEEVALLGSLAAHAAVAIDNARLLEETRTALEELSAANEVVRARSAAVERAAQAHDRMTALVVRGGGVEDVAAVVTEVLGGTLHVLDADGHRLATAGDHADVLDDDELSGVRASAHSVRAQGRTVRRGDLWIASVTTGDETLGTLVLRAPDEVPDDGRRILERAALVTALLLPIGLPVLPAQAAAASDVVKARKDFADEYGWPELARQVQGVYRGLPEAERGSAVILAANYGEAGALDLYGPGLGLPPAVSPHLTYYYWAPPRMAPPTVISVGYPGEELRPLSVRPTSSTGTIPPPPAQPASPLSSGSGRSRPPASKGMGSASRTMRRSSRARASSSSAGEAASRPVCSVSLIQARRSGPSRPREAIAPHTADRSVGIT